MVDPIPLFDMPTGGGPSPLRTSVARMVEALEGSDRIQVEHLPLVALAYKLADALEQSSGRGASVALLSAQFSAVWERLQALPFPVAAVDSAFEVELVPVEPVPHAG